MRILIAELKQETATFNPCLTRYEDFHIHRGAEILEHFDGTRTEVAGAIDVFREAGVEIVPVMTAAAVSGGPILQDDLDRLLGELRTGILDYRDVDGAYLCLHGAMAGETEFDPEGHLLEDCRTILGEKPLVASLDLHAILTEKMIRSADILVPYQTYPHIDHYETGCRAARNLLRLIRKEIRPVTARVALPMLVRGDELITATGKFGEAIRACQQIENAPKGLAAGVIIGNAFTDVPDLQSNVLVTTDNDKDWAESEAQSIARLMWEHRELFQAELTPLEQAIQMAETSEGLTVFSDAADATASGAAGDSNAILKGLLERGFSRMALLPIVDAAAVKACLETGVGQACNLKLGGTRDRGRFQPLIVNARVKSLHDGRFTYEDGTKEEAGHCAVVTIGSIVVLITERPVYVVGRRVFQQHGLDPQDFEVVVVKSPNGFRTWYESIASTIVPVDAPGSTSANLRSLPYVRCVRPIFPLDPDVPSPFD